MIIAVTSSKQEIKSEIDERFGRCNYFYIYNTETKKGEFIENSFKDGGHGVGTKIVEFLANKSVSEIFAVEVGGKADELLKQLNIKANITPKGTIVENIINNLKIL